MNVVVMHLVYYTSQHNIVYIAPGYNSVRKSSTNFFIGSVKILAKLNSVLMIGIIPLV